MNDNPDELPQGKSSGAFYLPAEKSIFHPQRKE
jgi:hypothetical protein